MAHARPITAGLVVATPASAATLEAMARLAAATGSIVHVVVERETGLVRYAREVARGLRISVDVDLRPNTLRVRFSPAPAADMA